MPTTTPARTAILLSLLLTAPLAFAADTSWPRWRGPADAGSTESGSYPARFDSSTNVLWKVPLEEKGCSTPIVWDERIYLTTPIEKQDSLIALDMSGKSLWQLRFGNEREGKNVNGSGCNSSPTTDG